MSGEFEAYGVGLVCASVCTSLPVEDAAARLNREWPTGISSRWTLSEDATFATGEPNPHPCERQPETHKHYLFEC